MVGMVLTSSVSLRAVEKAGDFARQFFVSVQSLWDGSPPVRTIFPFKFVLPQELPQCIHLQRSSLEYVLEATLDTTRGSMTKRVPLHLMRYMRPDWEALASEAYSTYSLNPVFWSFDSPMQVHMRLERTIYRHTEPISVQFHIPPPHGSMIMERRVQVHSVEASLVRLVAVTLPEMPLSDELFEQCAFPGTSVPGIKSTAVAHTGKLCRLHSQRALHLCLELRPSIVHIEAGPSGHSEAFIVGQSTGSCNNITQRTQLHDMRFAVRLRAVMYSDGKRCDAVAARLVKILPAPAGPVVDVARVDQQQREAQELGKQQDSDKAKIPNDEEQLAAMFEGQTEYDGYDDASAAGPSSLLSHALEPPPSHSDSARDVRVDELATPPRPEDELVAAMRIALAPPVSEQLLSPSPPAFDAPVPEDNVLPSYADAASMTESRSSLPRNVMLESNLEFFPPSYAQSAERPFRDSHHDTGGPFPPLYEA